MPNINKLLNKVNQASQAIKSAKGIKAQIASIGYKGGINTEEVDQLQEQAEKARQDLENRRKSLQKGLSAKNSAKKKAKAPKAGYIDLDYPIDSDYDNHIVFETRPRKSRKGGNLLNEKRVSIRLPIPQGGFDAEAKAEYETTEIGAFARGVMGGKNAGGMIEETINAVKGFISDAMGNMGGGIGNLRAGQAKNPMEEQTFKGIGFRSHSFSWTLMPRSAKEALEIEKIIAAFKVATLPDTFANYEGADLEWGDSEFSPSENFFNYPNIFDVYIEGPLAKQVERFLPMVCEDVTAGQIDDDDYLITQNTDVQWAGSKTLSLSFKEIKLMSQEVYASRVASEVVVPLIGEWGNLTDTTGSASILEGEQTATATPKEPKTPAT